MICYAIGTGASELPTYKTFKFESRKQSSYFYIMDNENYIIIDYGTNPFEYSTTKPLAGFITHFHSDHTAGLYSARWFPEKYPVYAPQEGNFLIKEPINTEPKTVKPFQKIKTDPFTITPVPLNHTTETYGYIIECCETIVAHLTDTKGLPKETTNFLLKNEPDKIVLDATFLTAWDYGLDKGRGHNNTEDILNIASTFPNSKIYLTHLPPYAPPTWVIKKKFPDFEIIHDGSTF